jgi:uncharacterized membrane protein YeiH
LQELPRLRLKVRSLQFSENFDFFGVTVVSFATALGGGVIRDVLIGAAPPQARRMRGNIRFSARC